MQIYHSALKDELFKDQVITAAQRNGNHVFVHNIVKNGLPGIYEKCDIIYSEPPWEKGYDTFLERANIPKTSNFIDYCGAINQIIRKFQTPIVLLCGPKMVKFLTKPDSSVKTKINGYLTSCYGWGIDLSFYEGNCKDNLQLIKCLAIDNKMVGDFCCGYGNTGKIFKENGKNFIMSDINPKCVTYVANNLI